jgi:hypothetical protein
MRGKFPRLGARMGDAEIKRRTNVVGIFPATPLSRGSSVR